MGTDSANSEGTRGAMDKRRRQGDSARKTGLDSVLQEVLTVVETGDGGYNKKTRDLQEWVPILVIAEEPEELWTNGDNRWIQRAKSV
jgi:hypothetical protein